LIDWCGFVLVGVFKVAFAQRHAGHFKCDTSHVGALFFVTMNGPECINLFPSLVNVSFSLKIVSIQLRHGKDVGATATVPFEKQIDLCCCPPEYFSSATDHPQ
jgi:hypothetical protein